MCLLMHLFYTARDITSHALGTIVSAMGPYGALGALGTSAMTYLLLQYVWSAEWDSFGKFAHLRVAAAQILISWAEGGLYKRGVLVTGSAGPFPYTYICVSFSRLIYKTTRDNL